MQPTPGPLLDIGPSEMATPEVLSLCLANPSQYSTAVRFRAGPPHPSAHHTQPPRAPLPRQEIPDRPPVRPYGTRPATPGDGVLKFTQNRAASDSVESTVLEGFSVSLAELFAE